MKIMNPKPQKHQKKKERPTYRSNTTSKVLGLFPIFISQVINGTSTGAATTHRCLDIIAPFVEISASGDIIASTGTRIIWSAVVSVTTGNKNGASLTAMAAQHRN